MKVWFRSGQFVGVALAFLLPRPPAASAQEPGATPPPLVSTPEIPPTKVISANPPAPTASPAVENGPAAVRAEQAHARPGGPQFMGAMTCSSSLCHGGGSAERNAYTIYNRPEKPDKHLRSAVKLTDDRFRLIATRMGLKNGALDARCTVCHAPMAGVPAERLPAAFDFTTEGITCESCHGAAQNWVRSHTRTDFTHAQNVQTGVRELRGLYARANSCVACHQVIPGDLLLASHPSLFFDLDRMTSAEPPHWKVEGGEYLGAQEWLTGQAVALRELSWALTVNPAPIPEEREQWRALVWLLQRAVDARGKDGNLPAFDDVPDPDAFIPGNVVRSQKIADDLARAAARLEWSRASVRRCLNGLSALDKEFVPAAGGEEETALHLRAIRHSLALTRLVVALQKQDQPRWNATAQEADKLLALSDPRKGFNGAAYAEELRRFQTELARIEAD